MARRISGVGLVTVSERRSTNPDAPARFPARNGSSVTPSRLGPAVTVAVVAFAAELDGIFGLAVELATRAGQLLLEEAPGRAEDVSTKSSRTDMVTAVDRASEALIVRAIERERPGDGVLG
ncbi:MAG: hypothetical protein JO075_00330, partial [Acidimicrobiia bacterium]|nr:hypothetical protein [Acidimicrobiia bacterium]